jgi:thiol-disulfide isomerase/thioredoxin
MLTPAEGRVRRKRDDRQAAARIRAAPAFDDCRAVQADLADGKPRLLNIWASWCLPCIAEAPQLEAA